MPRRRNSSVDDDVIAKVASALSRARAAEDAPESLVLTLEDSCPGLKAWILRHSRSEGKSRLAWIAGSRPLPFPETAGGSPFLASAAALASGSSEAPGQTGPSRGESAWLKKAGGAWRFLPVGRAPAPGLLVVSHPDESRLAEINDSIAMAANLLRPWLDLAVAREDLQSRIEERTSDLALFYETSRALAYAKTAGEIASAIADHLARELELQVVGLISFGPDRPQLILEAAEKASASNLRSFRRSIMREAATVEIGRLERPRIRINRLAGAASLRGAEGHDIHIPLIVQERRLGLFSARSSTASLRPDHERLLYTVAHQAALTLDRVFSVEQAGFLRMKTLLDSMTDGVVLLDDRRRVVLANPAARRLVAEIDGSPLPARMRDLGGVSIDPLLRGIAATGAAPAPLTIRVEEPPRIFHLHASPVAGMGEGGDGAVLLLSDVTRERQMQERLSQSEKLSSLGVMISGFAHELNNPLASIVGFAQLLVERPLEGDTRRKVEIINAEAARCRGIVENLLRFARREPPERRPQDLNSIVGSVVSLMGYQLQTDNITVDVELEPNMLPILGDFHQLQQVLVNIVQNAHQALKSSRDRGVLKITTRCDGLTCRVEIADDGPGIKAENLGNIFDPFFTTKGVGQGTGLGLSIAYGTVKEHNGEIYAHSRVGRGTTFVVDLPVCALVEEAREPADLAATAPGPVAAGRRILIVEDEGSLAEMMCEALAAEGHHVDSAADGDTAWRMLRGGSYDLIISDIKMPNMGGRELYDAVLKDNPVLARRIIFSTGDSVSGETQAFFKSVGNPHLTKPFNLTDLYRIVQQTLQHS